MAHKPTSSHNFQKLKLDTTTPHKSIPSAFASLPASSDPNNCRQSQLTAKLAGAEPQNIPSGASARNLHNDPLGQLEYGSAASSASDEDGYAVQVRQRTTSISFDSEVKLDSGQRVGLGVPVPKHARHSHSRSPESGSYSDQEYLEMPYHTKRNLQHRVGESRYPLLQSTVDDLANELQYHDQVASLTSETTASPPLEEARTPLDPPSEYMLSPLSITSPADSPFDMLRQHGPTRNKSFRSDLGENGSLRRASRRSSTRSGRSLSSMSPAVSFLARYKASETPMRPTEPDDEGQGIGYDSEYIIGKQIGYGGFSIVKEVTSMEDGKPVVNAVKVVRKLQRGKSEFENERIQSQFDQEVEIWRFLRHAYILPLLRVYTTDFATFCITELIKGGTLFDVVRDLRRKKKAGLPEHQAKRYAYQIASAMRYLHNDVQVVHRDIKLENVLLDTSGPNAERAGGDVLLCDFGMADFIVSDQRDGPDPHSIGDNQNIGPADTSTSVAGSLQYAAPELFQASGPVFSPVADVWAYGVIIFALLTATLPFNDGLDIKTVEKIQKGEWSEELIRNAEAVQGSGVEDALALIRGCLTVDVENRWTVHDILECAWLRDCENRYENVSRAWVADS